VNGDVATRFATRSSDPIQIIQHPPGHKYCWKCSTYKGPDSICFGGRCWDCTHTETRKTGARAAVRLLVEGYPGAALLRLAASLDEQARAEGIMLPPQHTVTRNGYRRLLAVSLTHVDALYGVHQ
jgi:hypothetical protein